MPPSPLNLGDPEVIRSLHERATAEASRAVDELLKSWSGDIAPPALADVETAIGRAFTYGYCAGVENAYAPRRTVDPTADVRRSVIRRRGRT